MARAKAPLGAGSPVDTGGVTAPFNYGTNVGSQYMQGGGGIYPGSMVDLVTPLKRANFYSRTSLEITPNMEGSVCSVGS